MTSLIEAASSTTVPAPAVSGVRLTVEYWTVTMDGQDSCGSCDQVLGVVTEALDTIRPLAQRLDIAIRLDLRTVTTLAEAVDHEIAASPTVRAAGLELRPTHRDTTEVRTWRWRGTTSTSLTVEATLDFLIQAIAAHSQQHARYLASGGPAPYVRQFLQPVSTIEGRAPADCC